MAAVDSKKEETSDQVRTRHMGLETLVYLSDDYILMQVSEGVTAPTLASNTYP